MSNCLQPHELQHARPPCPSATPEAYSNSCPLSQWCHPTISFSVVPFSFSLQSFAASGSFPMSQLFASKVDKVLELQHQSSQWYPGLISFRIDWFDLFAVPGTLKSLLQHHKLKAYFFLWFTLSLITLKRKHGLLVKSHRSSFALGEVNSSVIKRSPSVCHEII